MARLCFGGVDVGGRVEVLKVGECAIWLLGEVAWRGPCRSRGPSSGSWEVISGQRMRRDVSSHIEVSS
jgi:hypothetical protein